VLHATRKRLAWYPSKALNVSSRHALRIAWWNEFAKRAVMHQHFHWFPVNLKPEIQSAHKKTFLNWWRTGPQAWVNSTRETVILGAKVYGDPHPPYGLRVLRLHIGTNTYYWKPGDDRARIEIAVQQMIQSLGYSEQTGLAPFTIENRWGGALTLEQSTEEVELSDLHVLGLAHLILLSICFGIYDLHNENIQFSAKGIHVMDSECFGIKAPSDRGNFNINGSPFEVTERLLNCWLGPIAASTETSARLLEAFPSVFERVRNAWPELLRIRKSVDRLQSRVVVRSSQEFFELLPYIHNQRFKERAKELLRFHHPDWLPDSVENLIQGLENGCIPKTLMPIPPMSSDSAMILEPTPLLESQLRYLIQRMSSSTEAQTSWWRDLAASDLSQFQAPLEATPSGHPPYWAQRCESSAGPEIRINSPGLGIGLTGTLMTAYAERLSGKSIPSINDSLLHRLENGLAAGIIQNASNNSLYLGLGGALAGCWSLAMNGCLARELEQALLRALDLDSARPMNLTDLFNGEAGLVLGLARAADFLPMARIHDRARRQFSFVDDALYRLVTQAANEAQIGFAHGIAGTIWALHEAENAFAWRSKAINPAVDILQQAVELQRPSSFAEKAPPFCSSLEGGTAVLWRTGRANRPRTFSSDRKWVSSICCGLSGLALAWNDPSVLPVTPQTSGSIHGYLPGAAGIEYAYLAKSARLYDPIWGTEIFS
jgi:hypothetical protein